ncbi:glycoside hydrolase family 16 protein [Sulfuriroseicoccus oceanibius]|uniref:Glycoside hydrolase family 16 protein n=1 Tax=Sulfuriroseicoccus oceanibius TaxID=2707525 RepID=A0A6B3L3D6_9BACT|nr:glycoside hydrolase family 16 protein [Sulfuriroseicoccus oceanibius]QQL44103.1 glycoside hydrolase family 16 protein [Sulfuriroseicoccus oceanibius]
MRALVLFLSVANFVLANEASQWRLVWSDEFDGPELDFSKWAVEENGHGGGNQELQYYLDRKKNVRTENGYLVIQANREKVNVAGVQRDFTSGRIRTKRRAAWQYGRFEVRARLPKGQGIWPAIWMLPEDERYGGWAASGEIDIVETVGHQPDKVHGTLHFGDKWPNNRHSGSHFSVPNGDFSKQFHVFSLEWEPTEMRWYVDGELYQTINKWDSTAAPYPAPFDQPFHLIINLAVGGNWPGVPNATTPFPALMRVDYVRVYQRTEPAGEAPETQGVDKEAAE